MTEKSAAGAGKVKESTYYRPSIKRLRIMLMFFMCIFLFGFPTDFGGYVRIACGFVPPAFFIISGYLVLRESKDRTNRIVRAVKRSAVVFGVLALVYFALNYVYFRIQGEDIMPVLGSLRTWFNFIVLNEWPFQIGDAIWYVQALLYAYIIIYFLKKLKLLKFDWLIAVILLAFGTVVGELSGVVRFELFGYQYISGNFLTRALPYILLGSFLHRKRLFFKLVPTWGYVLSAFAGIVMTFGEMILLDHFGVLRYYNHLVGMGIVAFSLCMMAIKDINAEPGFEVIFDMSRWHVNGIYYLCQPVALGLTLLLPFAGENSAEILSGYIGLITFAVCFLAMWLAAFIKGRISSKHG